MNINATTIPIIKIKGSSGRIHNEYDRVFLQDLDDELSYEVLGAEYSRGYKMGFWDGKTRLLKNNLSFAIGLLQRVLNFYKKRNKEVVVEDLNNHSLSTPIDISANLKQLNIEPRYYQVNATNAALKHKRGIIKATTGCGKTLIAAMLTANVGKQTVIYVIGKDLLWQFHGFFEKVFNKKIGIIGDGECQIEDITICSIWTAGAALGIKNKIASGEDADILKEKKVNTSDYTNIRKLITTAQVTILDECHLGAAQTFQSIFSQTNSEYNIGLSASPEREDNQNILIESCFGQQIFTISASELISKGYLVTPHIRFLPVSKPKILPFKTYPEIYKHYIINNDERNDLAIKACEKLLEQGFVVLILFSKIQHGKNLYKKCQEKNINCKIIDGSDSTDVRACAIDSVRDGKCNVLLASTILDCGFDCTRLSALIITSGGKSRIRAIQRLGRVIRPYPGKTMAAIIDFNDSVKFLCDHSNARKEVYSLEDGFKVL